MPTSSAVKPSWGELLNTALLGTDRRPLPSGTDLLGEAALHTVRRRAGRLPGPAPARSAVAAPAVDVRASVPEAARRRLASLLTRGGHAEASLTSPAELLPQWLAAASAHGYRAPRELVPALLDAGRSRTELRAEIAAFTGPLGRWLAALNPEWRYLTRIPLHTESSEEAEAVQADVQSLWQEGLFAERVALLARLRRRDPAAALALLGTTWRTERAEDRALFLDALQESLSPADEPFLEAALDDRAKSVRATAAELLAALPGSALAARMTERARALVELTGTVGAPRLLVHPPTACDPALRRDGVPEHAPTGRGDRAFWLGEIVAATPLALWTSMLGTPERILALPADDDWRAELHEAWARAAVRQHDVPWARALLARTEPVPQAGTAAKLLTVLEPEHRAEWTARLLADDGLNDAFQALVTCPGPWPQPLSTAVVAALAGTARRGGYPWSHSGVLGLAERSLDPSVAPELDALAASCSAAWAEILTRLSATLRLRAAMLAELQPR